MAEAPRRRAADRLYAGRRSSLRISPRGPDRLVPVHAEFIGVSDNMEKKIRGIFSAEIIALCHLVCTTHRISGSAVSECGHHMSILDCATGAINYLNVSILLYCIVEAGFLFQLRHRAVEKRLRLPKAAFVMVSAPLVTQPKRLSATRPNQQVSVWDVVTLIFRALVAY